MKKYLSLSIWIISLVTVGFIMGQLTKANVDTWYMQLNLAPLTPPNYLFGIVWSILYVMLGVTGWLIFCENCKPVIKTLFLIQLLLNWCWTPLFFHFHLLFLAMLCLITIIILVKIIVIKAEKLIKILLTPYLIWLLYALYLNIYIWLYN